MYAVIMSNSIITFCHSLYFLFSRTHFFKKLFRYSVFHLTCECFCILITGRGKTPFLVLLLPTEKMHGTLVKCEQHRVIFPDTCSFMIKKKHTLKRPYLGSKKNLLIKHVLSNKQFVITCYANELLMLFIFSQALWNITN